jgi:hypothetical protein
MNAMSISELLSSARALPLDEKRELTRALIDDLPDDVLEAMFKGRHVFGTIRPEFAPGAVAQLAQLLKEDAETK